MGESTTAGLKDHQIAQTVNALAAIAREYGQTQQLRERIVQVIVPILKGEGFPRSIVNAYVPSVPANAAVADPTPSLAGTVAAAARQDLAGAGISTAGAVRE